MDYHHHHHHHHYCSSFQHILLWLCIAKLVNFMQVCDAKQIQVYLVEGTSFATWTHVANTNSPQMNIHAGLALGLCWGRRAPTLPSAACLPPGPELALESMKRLWSEQLCCPGSVSRRGKTTTTHGEVEAEQWAQPEPRQGHKARGLAEAPPHAGSVAAAIAAVWRLFASLALAWLGFLPVTWTRKQVCSWVIDHFCLGLPPALGGPWPACKSPSLATTLHPEV